VNLLRFILATLAAVLSIALWLHLGALIPEHAASQWLAYPLAALRIAHVLALLIVFALLAGIAWPLGRRWVFDRLSRRQGRGLSDSNFRALHSDERRILRRLRKPADWAPIAQVAVSEIARSSDGDLRERVRLPSVIRCELTPSGPAVVVRVARGSVPSAFTEERISAAVDAPIRVTATAPREVHLQAVTRDPLAAPAHPVPSATPAADALAREWFDTPLPDPIESGFSDEGVQQ